jgi:hypothetical protein
MRFANCIEHLVRGGDIYKILEQIIVMQANTQEKLSELISSGVLRQEIIVSKERFDELKWSVILPLTVCYYEMLPKA